MNIDLELINRYLEGTCSPEEIAQVQAYFQQGDYTDLDDMLKKAWEHTEATKPLDADKVRGEIWHQLAGGHVSPSKSESLPAWSWLLATAAAILLFVLFRQNTPSPAAKSTFWQTDINTSWEPMEVALADGSTVWLTPGSRLSYPLPFDTAVRKVRLEGEAYFQVQADAARPFEVAAHQVITRALGTAFNVRATETSDRVEVALLEGKVAIDIVKDSLTMPADTLQPGEAFSFSQQLGESQTHTISTPHIYQWTGGIIRFQRASLDEVVETLQRWYGIEIRIDPGADIQQTLVHRIDTRKMTLEELLAGIDLVATYRFEKVADRTYIVKADD